MKDPAKTRESQLDALEVIFKWINTKYHKLRSEETDYDSNFAPPSRDDLKAALIELVGGS